MYDSQGYDKLTADLVYKRISVTFLLLFTAEESSLFFFICHFAFLYMNMKECGIFQYYHASVQPLLLMTLQESSVAHLIKKGGALWDHKLISIYIWANRSLTGLGTTVINIEILDTYYHRVNGIECNANLQALYKLIIYCDDGHAQMIQIFKVKSFCSSFEVFKYRERSLRYIQYQYFLSRNTTHIT